MALLAPNPLLAVDTITTNPRTDDKGVRGDVFYGNATGTEYPAIVTMQASSAIRTEDLGQPLGVSRWDIVIFSTVDPLVKTDHELTDQNGRILTAISPSTQRETGAWYVQAQAHE